MITLKSRPGASPTRSAYFRGAVVSLAALALAGCAEGIESIGHHAAFVTLDAQQQHPIVVSQAPASLSLKVARGSDGLAPHQRANLADFLSRYRSTDSGNGRLTISVPSGAPNEVSALKAVADVRELIRDYGIDDSRVALGPYHSASDHQPPIRISYSRFVAEAPECGVWPTNLAGDSRNLPHPNLGCATQRNFAMQVANPADLLGPRTMTPAVGERRDAKWEKFVKGDVVISKKDEDERASVKAKD